MPSSMTIRLALPAERAVGPQESKRSRIAKRGRRFLHKLPKPSFLKEKLKKQKDDLRSTIKPLQDIHLTPATIAAMPISHHHYMTPIVIIDNEEVPTPDDEGIAAEMSTFAENATDAAATFAEGFAEMGGGASDFLDAIQGIEEVVSAIFEILWGLVDAFANI